MKGKREKVTMGSGNVYYKEFTSIPETATELIAFVKEMCEEENRMGYIKNGANVEYKPSFTKEKDDLGVIVKEVLTEEEATFKTGLFTWNGDALLSLCSTATKDETAEGYRIISVGGIGNDNGKQYAILFHHEDKEEGDCYVLIVGRNTEGFTLAFAKDSATVIDATFTCKPQDKKGTLIRYIEEVEVASE